jgi:hypothetical protein
MVPGILQCVEEITASIFRQEEVYPKVEKRGLLHHFKLNTEVVSMYGL